MRLSNVVVAIATVLTSVFVIVASFSQDATSGPDSSTGQIKGTVLEKDTKLPVIGVSVLVKGTKFGARTDFDGKYQIKSLEAGVYTLVITSVEFNTVEVSDVVVTRGQTTEQNVSLTKKLNDLDVNIEVKAKADINSKYETANQSQITESEIKSRPVTTSVDNLLKSVQGVQSSPQGQVYVRGGRAGAAPYIASGAPLNDPLGGMASLNPLPQGTERYGEFIENKFLRADREPLSTFSIDVDKASYANVRRFLTDGSLPPVDAVRIEELVNYFAYDYADPVDDRPFAVHIEASDCPWNREHRLVRVALQGRRIDISELPPSNLVFLIDVSGSMQPENKLPLLKRAMRMLVNNLRPFDQVAIVVYASATGLVLEPTKGRDKWRILDALNRLDAGGSTAGAAGIQLAYRVARENFIEGGNNRVILATDGDFNVGVSSDKELEQMITRKRSEGVFLTVLGFGEGNLQDKKMEMLADKGNGTYYYIDNLREAHKTLVAELGATLFTIAKDVKIQIEFNPARVKEYRLVGYENRMLAERDFDDDTKDAGEIGAGHTVTAFYEIIPALRAESQGLRYQHVVARMESSHNTELMLVKLRYKAPDEDVSELIEEPFVDHQTPLAETSIEFRFAAAVAEFGLLIRDSEHKSQAAYQDVLALAKSSLGKDDSGERHEFIRLVETSQLIAKGYKD